MELSSFDLSLKLFSEFSIDWFIKYALEQFIIFIRLQAGDNICFPQFWMLFALGKYGIGVIFFIFLLVLYALCGLIFGGFSLISAGHMSCWLSNNLHLLIII